MENKPSTDQREAWLSGPVPGIPALLQPVAHALIQARKEIREMMKDFPAELLWERPGGVASPAFHLQHIRGVLDRLFTYADNRQLTAAQMDFLTKEGKQDEAITIQQLLDELSAQVDVCLQYLEKTDTYMLTNTRGVGRKLIPTTLQGLLFHSAEHTMRHTGQLLVTTRVLRNK